MPRLIEPNELIVDLHTRTHRNTTHTRAQYTHSLPTEVELSSSSSSNCGGGGERNKKETLYEPSYQSRIQQQTSFVHPSISTIYSREREIPSSSSSQSLRNIIKVQPTYINNRTILVITSIVLIRLN